MKILKLLILCFVILISFMAGYCWKYLFKEQLVYELKKPLIIESLESKDKCCLPAGTLLYHDWSPGEGGFNTFRVYVNIFGPSPQLHPVDKRGLIAPLMANTVSTTR